MDDREQSWWQPQISGEKLEKVELSIQDLQYPERLPHEIVKHYLVKRGIVDKGNNQDKESLLHLFRNYISPLSQRNECLEELNVKVKAVTLNPQSVKSGLERKRKMDDNSEGSSNELTVKIPVGSKTECRHSKPVKLKRKSYDIGRKHEGNSRMDEMDVAIKPKQTEISKMRPLVSEKGMQLVSREMSHASAESRLVKKNLNPKVCDEAGITKNSRKRQIQLGGRNCEVDSLVSASTTKQPYTKQDDDVSEMSGSNSPVKETIHISIGSGKVRSTTVVSKDEQNEMETQSVVEHFEAEELHEDDDELDKSTVTTTSATTTTTSEKPSVFSRLDTISQPEKLERKKDHENMIENNNPKNKNTTLKNQQFDKKETSKTNRNEESRNIRHRSRERVHHDVTPASQRSNNRNHSPQRQIPLKYNDKWSGNRLGCPPPIHQQRMPIRGRSRPNRPSDVRRDYRADNPSRERMLNDKSYDRTPRSQSDRSNRIQNSSGSQDNLKSKNVDTKQLTDKERKSMEEEVKKLDMMIEIKSKKNGKKPTSESDQQTMCESASINLAIHSIENTSEVLHGTSTKSPISSQSISKFHKPGTNIHTTQHQQLQQQQQQQQQQQDQQQQQQRKSQQQIDGRQDDLKIDAMEDTNKETAVQSELKRKLVERNSKSQPIPPSKKPVNRNVVNEKVSSVQAPSYTRPKKSSLSVEPPTIDMNSPDASQDNDSGADHEQREKKHLLESQQTDSQAIEVDVASDSEEVSAASQQTESSEASEPQRKKKVKSKRKKRHIEEDETSNTSASDDSDTESEPSKKRKRKRKKKKKSKKNRHSKKKKRKSDKGNFVSAEEFASIKRKMKEEILKEIQTGITEPNNVETALKSDVSTDSTAVDITPKIQDNEEDEDDLKLDYSSEDDDVDQHGFLTGIPLRKDSVEIENKTPEILDHKDEIVEVFNSGDDILDLELEEDETEENWKRHKKDDDTAKPEKKDRERRNETRRSRYGGAQPRCNNSFERNRGERSFTRRDRIMHGRNDRDKTSPRERRGKDSPRDDRDKDSTRDNQVKDSARDDQSKDFTKNDRVRDHRDKSTREDRANASTRDDRVNDSTRDDRVKDSTRDDRVNDSTRDDRVKGSTRDDRVKDSTRDDRVKDSTRDDRVKDSMRDDRVKDSTRDDRVKDSVRDNRDKASTRDDRIKNSTSDDRVKDSTRDDRFKDSTRDDRVKDSIRDDRDKAARDDRDKASSRDDRVNTSMRGGRVNASTRDDRANASARDDRLNASTRDDRDKASSRDDRVNTSMRGGRVQESTRDDRVKDSTRNDRIKESIRDDHTKHFMSDDRRNNPVGDNRSKEFNNDAKSTKEIYTATKNTQFKNESTVGFKKKRNRFDVGDPRKLEEVVDDKPYRPLPLSTSQMNNDVKTSEETINLDNFWKPTDKISDSRQSTIGESGHWEAPYIMDDSKSSHINSRLLNIAELSYNNQRNDSKVTSTNKEEPLDITIKRRSRSTEEAPSTAAADRQIDNKRYSDAANSVSRRHGNVDGDGRTLSRSHSYHGKIDINKDGIRRTDNIRNGRHSGYGNNSESNHLHDDTKSSFYNNDRKQPSREDGKNAYTDDDKRHHHQDRPPSVNSHSRPRRSSTHISNGQSETSSQTFVNQHGKSSKSGLNSYAMSLNRLDGSDSPNMDNTPANDHSENFTHPKKHYRGSKNR